MKVKPDQHPFLKLGSKSPSLQVSKSSSSDSGSWCEAIFGGLVLAILAVVAAALVFAH